MNIDKMRQKQATITGGAPKAAKAEPTAALITHTCGHITEDIPEAKGREARIAKEQARDCPTCRKARHEALMAKQAEATKKKVLRPKGPQYSPETAIGCEFRLAHVGLAAWRGRLFKIDSEEHIGETFEGRSFRQMMLALNRAAAEHATQETP